jgi:hypothetical protein
MKIMPLLALAGLLAFPALDRAEAAVDCGSFPNSQMRLTCWSDTSRALQAYNPGQMPPDNVVSKSGACSNARHARACPGHPRLATTTRKKT